VAMARRFHIGKGFADCPEIRRLAPAFTISKRVDPPVNNIC
jgi:hypothetical protein